MTTEEKKRALGGQLKGGVGGPPLPRLEHKVILPQERTGTTHRVKILPRHYREHLSGAKTFELRKDDRGYAVGDHLAMCEWLHGEGRYTGRVLWRQITHLIRGPRLGLAEGFCVLSILPEDVRLVPHGPSYVMPPKKTGALPEIDDGEAKTCADYLAKQGVFVRTYEKRGPQ